MVAAIGHQQGHFNQWKASSMVMSQDARVAGNYPAQDVIAGRHSRRQELRLSVAIGEYDRTQQLLSGAVAIDGVDPIFMVLEPEEIFFRAFRNAEFDIAELSLSSFTLQTAQGVCPYVGIPAFLSRAFRHTAIYVRSDRIKKPQDLIGKRVGIPEYQLTAHVWVRALLASDYGVEPRDIRWIQGGIEEPDREEKIKFSVPSDVRIEAAPPNRSLSDMLAAGEIDAVVAPRAPSCFVRNAPHVGWLFDDPESAASDYFRRTGIFPIMHMLGIRRELAERYPFLPVAIFKGFEMARSIAVKRLADVTALRTSLPFGELHLKTTQNLMGPEFWSYGVTPVNRMVLDTFLNHHHAQGLTPRRLSVDELFFKSTYDLVKI